MHQQQCSFSKPQET